MNNTKKARARSSIRTKTIVRHDTPDDFAPLLLTTEAAARSLSISPRLLRKLGKEGEIPVVKVRSLVRFDAQDLSSWIARLKTQGESRRGR